MSALRAPVEGACSTMSCSLVENIVAFFCPLLCHLDGGKALPLVLECTRPVRSQRGHLGGRKTKRLIELPDLAPEAVEYLLAGIHSSGLVIRDPSSGGNMRSATKLILRRCRSERRCRRSVLMYRDTILTVRCGARFSRFCPCL